MKQICLSVQQPWAELIISGRKQVENRTWRTRYRGPLGIHSSTGRQTWKRLAPAERDDYAPGWRDGSPLAWGCLLGIVDLVDICRYPDLPESLRSHPFADSSAGIWCWVLVNPRRFAQSLRGKGNSTLFYLEVGELV